MSLFDRVTKIIDIHATGLRFVVVGKETDAIAAVMAPCKLIRFSEVGVNPAIKAVGVLALAVKSPGGLDPQVVAGEDRSESDPAVELVFECAGEH